MNIKVFVGYRRFECHLLIYKINYENINLIYAYECMFYIIRKFLTIFMLYN